MKRKLIVSAICFLFLTLLCAGASAHSGRTDSSGGHYDNSTGEYHYHHGYPAHQHENGVCPYDFDSRSSNSGFSSNSSSGSALDSVYSINADSALSVDELEKENSTLKAQSNHYKDLYQETLTELNKLKMAQTKQTRITSYIVLGFAILLVIAGFFIFYERRRLKKLINNVCQDSLRIASQKDEVIKKQESAIQTLKTSEDSLKANIVSLEKSLETSLKIDEGMSLLQAYKNKKELFRKLSADVSNEQLAGIPFDTEIGLDGWPKEKGSTTGWGDKYTAYFSFSAKTYHKASCHYTDRRTMKAVNIFDNKSLEGKMPCKICNPVVERKWWDDYLLLQQLQSVLPKRKEQKDLTEQEWEDQRAARKAERAAGSDRRQELGAQYKQLKEAEKTASTQEEREQIEKMKKLIRDLYTKTSSP